MKGPPPWFSVFALLLPLRARGEVDSGTFWFRDNHGVSARVAAFDLDRSGLSHREVWVTSSAFAHGHGSASLGAGRTAAASCGRDAVRYGMDVSYVAASLGPYAVADATARVRIDGELVGWRLVDTLDDGSLDETWVLLARYVPPRPEGVQADVALQRGWSRPYAERVDLAEADPTEVVAELAAAAADGALDDALQAQGHYVPVAVPAPLCR